MKGQLYLRNLCLRDKYMYLEEASIRAAKYGRVEQKTESWSLDLIAKFSMVPRLLSLATVMFKLLVVSCSLFLRILSGSSFSSQEGVQQQAGSFRVQGLWSEQEVVQV